MSLSEALETAVARALKAEKRLTAVDGTPPIVVQHIVSEATIVAVRLLEAVIERREPQSVLLQDWSITEHDELLPADECVCDEEGVVLSREYAEELAREEQERASLSDGEDGDEPSEWTAPCSRCGKSFGPEEGSDDLPELCDDCWADARKAGAPCA